MKVALIVVVALSACEHGSTPARDAPGDPVACKAELEASIDRSCNVPSDCVLVTSADCCGVVMLAVKSGTEAAFPAVESTFEFCLACPPLGCNHADQAEDGSVPGANEAIVATCEANQCKSVIAAAGAAVAP